MIAPLGPVYQVGTLSGNPLAMTAGFSALSYIKATRDLFQLEKSSSYIEEGFKENLKLLNKHYTINRVGSMLSKFFTDKEVIDFKIATTSNTELYAKYFHFMLNEGIYLPPAQFEAMFISTAHSKEELDNTIKAHHNSIKKLLN